MGRRKVEAKRSRRQAAADRSADDLATQLGKSLRNERQRQRLTQVQCAGLAGLSQSTWSQLEIGRDGRITLATWNRAAAAVGGRLRAYVEQASAADAPRDAVHLRNQELVMRVAASGGWRSLPEVPIERDARSSRMADIVLTRGDEYALVEVFDWFDDVGAAARDWPRRLEALERHAITRMRSETLPRINGVWIVRATRRNRQLINEHRRFFAALLPGSSAAWLLAMAHGGRPMPDSAAVLWATVSGDRLFQARVGSPNGSTRPPARG